MMHGAGKAVRRKPFRERVRLRLRHDGNPVLSWCLGNVVGKADRRGNLYPTKSRPDQKIDAAVALMMAIGRAMVEDEQAKGLEGFLTHPIFG
jgi:phage terminase large subunit-like protein